MGSNGSSNSEQDTFLNAIEDAVDNLFTQYEKKEAASPAPTEPDLELEANEEISQAFGKISDLLTELNQALLAIDWEVNQTNVGTARDILANIRKELGKQEDSKPGRMIELMDQVLAAIATAPESVPISGPKALQDGLAALSMLTKQGAAPDATTQSLVESACEELKDSLPQAAKAEQSKTSKPTDLQLESQEAESAPIPAALFNVIRANLANLEQCINRLAPVENLFNGKPGYEKLQAIYQKLRESMQQQKTIIATALHRDYLAAPNDLSPSVPAELIQLLQQHLTILGQCKSRIQPLENLFAKKLKFEKLQAIHQKLREQFEDQIDAFTRALQGDYKPTAVSRPAVPQATADQACPWDNLHLAQWKGKTVALVPEHVAFEKLANRWTAKNLGLLASFPLKRLKAWPWSKLRPMLRGEISQLPEKDLKHLILPVLNHPDPLQHSAVPAKNQTLVILYHQTRGGIIMLDKPCTEIKVQPEWRWQAYKRSGSIISGMIKTRDEEIPVVSLTNI